MSALLWTVLQMWALLKVVWWALAGFALVVVAVEAWSRR